MWRADRRANKKENMSSERKRISNRANAQASTGPKTAPGKSRATRNAYRHGLSVRIFANPALSVEAEELALEIAGKGANPEVVEYARRVAEAQIDLVRVRQARHDILSGELNDPEFRPRTQLKAMADVVEMFSRYWRRNGPEAAVPAEVAEYAYDVFDRKPQGPEKLAHILFDLSPRLIAMDRYERRALSRRKFAVRAFDLARQRSPN